MRCYLCGMEFKELREGICDSCYSKEFQLLEVPRKLQIVICKNCYMIKEGDKLTNKKVEDIIKENIKPRIEDVRFSINNNHVYATGMINGKQREEKYHLRIEEKKILCNRCAKMKSGYYESKLQLRGNVPENALDFIDSQIKKIESRNDNAFYRIEKIKDGLDVFVGSKSVANKIAEQMKKQLKAELKRSYKLYTRREGKDIYRDVISVRFT